MKNVLITQNTNYINFFFPSELVLDIEVEIVRSQNTAGSHTLKSRKIPCWLAEVSFLGMLAQGLWFSALSKVNAHCRASPPLCRTSAFGVIRRAIQKRNPFQPPCVVRGSVVFSSFISYLSRSMT